MNVTLLGLGGGAPENATVEAWDALESAELVIGAMRLLDTLPEVEGQRRFAAVRAEEIAALLSRESAESACVVMSGDTGFYSGAKGLLPTIISRCSMINLGGEAEINEEAQKAAEEIANGIISLSEYDLLLALRSLADKSLADDILRAVKLILFDAVTVLSGAKASYKPELAKKLSSRFTRKKLLDMIELTDSSKYKLKQNININLLTTQWCGEYRRISWQR